MTDHVHGWPVKRIKYSFPRFASGVSVIAVDEPAGDDTAGVLKTSSVYGNRFRPEENKRVVAEEMTRVSCPVTANSLIISRMNTPDLVGSCGYVDRDYKNLFLPDRLWIARFAGSTAMLGRFAYYMTASAPIQNLTGALATGTSGSMKNLSQDDFRNIVAPVPPLPAQRAIADFLDRKTRAIDELIRKKERLIELLQEKRQALITQAVTKGLDPNVPMKDSGVPWLGEIPAHWEVTPFRHLMRGGTRNGLYKSKEHYSDDGTPMIQMGEAFAEPVIHLVAKDRVNLTAGERSTWSLEEGDLLFARRSLVFEGSGKCSIVGPLPEPHVFESSLIRVRPHTKHVHPYFLFWFLQSEFSRSQVLSATKQVTISGIDSQQLRALTVVVPPNEEQKEIIAFIDVWHARFAAASSGATRSIGILREYRQALISAAVTGQIDVTGEAAA